MDYATAVTDSRMEDHLADRMRVRNLANLDRRVELTYFFPAADHSLMPSNWEEAIHPPT